MSTFTVPRLFPQLWNREAYTRQILKSSLIRKIAMAQNFIWSKFIRIYANGGYEGHGYRLCHIDGEFDPAIPGNTTLAGADTIGDGSGWSGRDQDILPDGVKGLCICSFLVPPNWGTSRRVLVQGEYTFAGGDFVNGELVNEADIWVVLCHRDGTVFSYQRWSDSHDGLKISTPAAAEDFSIEIDVPQDETYMIRVYIQHLDHSTHLNNTQYFAQTAVSEPDATARRMLDLNHLIEVKWISSRYDVANTEELNGEAAGQTWFALADFFRDGMPIASVFLYFLLQNTRHLAATRPPELCQAWLAEYSSARYNTYVEVGHYKFWTPNRVTKMKGKLVLCSFDAASNVRFLLNGAVVQTVALAIGENIVSLDEFTVPNPTENEITIEVRHGTAIMPFGSQSLGVELIGVSFWESGTTLGLPAGTTVPATFQPVDEEAIEGDDIITAERLNAFDQRAGLRVLFDNDRWLAFNRLRHIIGDWRHHALKRGGVTGTGEFDLRTDWTPTVRTDAPSANTYLSYIVRPKNITIRGDNGLSGLYDVDGKGGSPFGAVTTTTGITGYSEAPYLYPDSLDYPTEGARLAKFFAVRPTGVDSHMAALSQMRIVLRARRLRPAEMSTDSDGAGPTSEEAAYVGKGYLEFRYNTTVYRIPILAPPGSADANGVNTPGDVLPKWLNDFVVPHEDLDSTFIISGRLPKQASTYASQGRPEGMLFEVELLSWYIADEPLAPELLKSL